ncbi:hypothetical protein PM082_023414 [Marasmius tenuissimus]|nr:hypothetical protein PM082_023414 [Marasmius tenuissimus]
MAKWHKYNISLFRRHGTRKEKPYTAMHVVSGKGKSDPSTVHSTTRGVSMSRVSLMMSPDRIYRTRDQMSTDKMLDLDRMI